MSPLRTCAAAAAGVLLAACAALTPAPEVPRAPVRFDLLGRVAVNHDGRVFSSNVRWQHAPERDEIWLLTPTGQTLAYIVDDAGGAKLTGADQKQYRADNAESLTRQALGWELPLARLGYWVRGEPAPGAAPAGAERDDRSRLAALTQDGWRIAFVHYPPGEQDGLPRRLDLASGAHEIRLVIDGWRRDGDTP
ncbi:MAG: outer membrane lipoprotein LolB [Betaproteobacteria bacterium]|nr:outer membrane lipoprotein LolB [Betaproteobacteria bacterium]